MTYSSSDKHPQIPRPVKIGDGFSRNSTTTGTPSRKDLLKDLCGYLLRWLHLLAKRLPQSLQTPPGFLVPYGEGREGFGLKIHEGAPRVTFGVLAEKKQKLRQRHGCGDLAYGPSEGEGAAGAEFPKARWRRMPFSATGSRASLNFARRSAQRQAF